MRRLTPLFLITIAALSAAWMSRDNSSAEGSPGLDPSLALEREDAPGEVADAPNLALPEDSRPTTDRVLLPEDDLAARPVPPVADLASLKDLPGRAVLSITVLSAQTGEPLGDFALTLDQPTNAEAELPFTTTAEGTLITPALWLPGTVHFGGPPLHPETGTWALSPEAVSIPPGSTQREVVLHARAVRSPIDVLVLGPDGKPLANARVARVLGDKTTAGKTSWRNWYRQVTSIKGETRFFMEESDRARPLALFLFDGDSGLVSDVMEFQPPTTRGPFILNAYAPGSLSIRFTSPDGSPVENARASIRRASRLGCELPRAISLDDKGEATFPSLPGGEYFVSVRLANSRRGVSERSFLLEPGEDARFTSILMAEDVPQLAVAGKVIGKAGEPVYNAILSLVFEDGSREYAFSDESGHFEHLDSPSVGDVTVRPGASVFADVYEQEEYRVPFGTRDLVVQRARQLEEVIVLFEVVDAETSVPLPDALEPAVILHHPPSSDGRVHGVARFGITDGVSEIDFKPHPGLRWYVAAPGYREARGELKPPLAGEPPTLHRVALHRGFERTMVVRDQRDGTPLEGVQFVDPRGRNLGTSDAHGQVVLLDTAWPTGRLIVRREGYIPSDWNAEGYWSHHESSFWLRRE